MSKPNNDIKWGILGCGNIAHKFAEALSGTNGSVPLATAARDKNRAANFASKFGFKRSYGSYQELVNDPDVDIIYIATPHSYHFAHTKLCLEAGKHVLCEKPFTINAEQLRILIALAAQKDRFLMEALWSRFLPGMAAVKELLLKDAIGDPVIMEADFGLRFSYHPEHRLFNPLLGGGALLDLGIYPLFLSIYLFGKPETLLAHSVLHENNTDLITSMISYSKSGAVSHMNTTVLANTPIKARITGTRGMIEFDHWWFTPVNITVHKDEKTPELLEFPPMVNGYEYEIMEAQHCLLHGKIESEIMPLDFSMLLMEQMDRIRKMTGITYPEVIESTAVPYGWNEL
jgi:predicted dehydrogenase